MPEHFEWRRTENSLAFINDGNIVWQLNLDKKFDKPYFHPIALADGTVLTDCRPSDHPWHRGLWWSWKFINKINYWEENPATRLADGRSEIKNVELKTHGNGNAEAKFTIEYHLPAKPAILTEMRTIKVVAPDEKGVYRIDWKAIFTAADKDVLLDRTPIIGEPCGVIWGGYAGLSVRLAKDAKNFQITDSDGHIFDKEFNNSKARWLDYSFQTGAKGVQAGVTIFDHPSNPRYPSLWYVIAGDPMKYFSPAFLFNQSYTLTSGRQLELNYRVLVHPGPKDKQWLENQWIDFSKTKM